MKVPLQKFLVPIALMSPLCSQLFAETVVLPHGVFDGNSRKLFPVVEFHYPDGAQVFLSGNLELTNINKTFANTSLNCLGNEFGSFLFSGAGHSFSVSSARSKANGSVLSNSSNGPVDTFVITNFSTLNISNCQSLSVQENSVIPPQANPIFFAPSGTISSENTPLFIQQIDSFSLLNNQVYGSGGGIYANSCSIDKTAISLDISGNLAGKDGGAICVKKDLTIHDNLAERLSFKYNIAGGNGGAIHAKDTPATGAAASPSHVQFVNNQDVVFLSNKAQSGGAIYSENSVVFDQGNILFVSGNSAVSGDSGYGGGIFCKNTSASTPSTLSPDEGVFIQNYNTVSFVNNFATEGGGAIYADRVKIQNCGQVSFFDNSGENGGAIYIFQNGELYLSADKGDILFKNNMARTPATNNGSPTTSYNAIFLDSDATIKTLSAQQNNRIFFGDAVTSRPLTTQDTNKAKKLVINDNNAQGLVIFSSSQNDANPVSEIHQDVELASGGLVIEKGASLGVVSFEQKAGSVVQIDVGSTLKTTTNSAQQTTGSVVTANDNGSISLNNLHLNLLSLNNGTPAKITISGSNGTATLSGQLSLDDITGSGYENHNLLNYSTKEVDVLEISTQGTSKITVNNFNTTPTGNVSSNYGYQGYWSFQWKDGTGSDANKKKTLVATWKRTGFKPCPARISSLVPNSLWSSLIDAKSVNDILAVTCDGLGFRRGLWVSGVSNFFHHDTNSYDVRFRYISGGYLCGFNAQVANIRFGAAAGQTFGHSKDYIASNTTSRSYVGSAFISCKKPNYYLKNLPFVYSAKLHFTRGDEKMHARFLLPVSQEGECEWHKYLWLGELGAAVPFVPRYTILHLHQFTPFVNLQVAYGEGSAFSEKHAEARNFERTQLINIATPVGIKFDKKCSSHPNVYSFSIAYTPDIYRHNPSSYTTLIANGCNWVTHGTNLSRHAVALQGSSHTKVNNSIEIFGHGSCELRTTSRHYNVNVGSKIRF